MNIIEKLVHIANELDQNGMTKEADNIDALLTEAGFGDWFKQIFMGKKMPQCTCSCDRCNMGRDLADMRRMKQSFASHKQCEQGCPVKEHLENQ